MKQPYRPYTHALANTISHLIEQIELSDYQDELGHPLRNNLYYAQLLELVGEAG